MLYDVVLTTYQTLTCEQRRAEEHSFSLFSWHWHRVVLDKGTWSQIRHGSDPWLILQLITSVTAPEAHPRRSAQLMQTVAGRPRVLRFITG